MFRNRLTDAEIRALPTDLAWERVVTDVRAQGCRANGHCVYIASLPDGRQVRRSEFYSGKGDDSVSFSWLPE